MSNERYLQVSYFVVLLVSASLGLLIFGLLRRCFRAVCDESGSRIGPFVRRLFLFGTLAPAVLGFCSVSYFTCDKTTYQSIIADRGYLISVNFDQIHTAMLFTIGAVMLWCLIVLMVVVTGRGPGSPRAGRSPNPPANQ